MSTIWKCRCECALGDSITPFNTNFIVLLMIQTPTGGNVQNQQQMYSAASQEILSKISKIFPGAVFSDVNSLDSFSVSDFIQRIVQSLPVPAELETSSAILNMKDVVDGQELKIQRGMMDCEGPMMDEEMSSTESSLDSCSGGGFHCERYYEEGIWNPEDDCHLMADKYLTFLA